jgi:hypothetical protein
VFFNKKRHDQNANNGNKMREKSTAKIGTVCFVDLVQRFTDLDDNGFGQVRNFLGCQFAEKVTRKLKRKTWREKSAKPFQNRPYIVSFILFVTI